MPATTPLITWLLTYRYLIVYPLAIAEGPVVMLVSGFLLRLGVFELLPIYLLLVAGDFTGDVVWYYVGRHGARALIERYGHYVSVTENNVEAAERIFHTHQTKILFISKLTMGFGFALATLIAAGAARVPVKKYLAINLAGGFVWTGILMTAGYFLGHLYTLVDKSLRLAFIGAMIIIAMAAVYGFGKFMRKRFKDLRA